MPRLLALLVCVLSSACAPFPDLDARVSAEARAAPFPRLAPTDPILAAAPQPPSGTEGSALDARARTTEARAAGLRRPVLDAPSRARLEAASE